MRLVTALTILALVGLCTGAAYADKYDANEKPWTPTFPGVRAIFPEDEGVNNACPGQAITCGDEINPAAINPAGDLDWSNFYVANPGDLITIATNAINGSTTDTYLELYDACGGPMIAYDDDGGPGFFSLISNFPAPHSGTYYIKVRGYSTSTTGEYKLNLTCQGGTPPPPDDTCDGAGTWTRCTSGTMTGDLFPYVNNYDPGSGGCASGYPEAGKDQVVAVALEAGDVISISYTQLNADAAIYIITDCTNPAGSCVVGADDTVTGDPETINWVVTATGTYYVILDCYGTGQGGAYVLDYNITCPGATGACCVNYVCTIMTSAECERAGGTYYGDGSTCDPTPCPPPIPTEEKTWGTIKSNYR